MKQSIEALNSKISSFFEPLICLMAATIVLIMYQSVNFLCNSQLGQLTHKYTAQIYLRRSRQQLLTGSKNNGEITEVSNQLLCTDCLKARTTLLKQKQVLNAVRCTSEWSNFQG